MGFALNRISCGLFYLNQLPESLQQNERCMELMDQDNLYATLYNSGIILRKMLKYQQSIHFFEKVKIP